METTQQTTPNIKSGKLASAAQRVAWRAVALALLIITDWRRSRHSLRDKMSNLRVCLILTALLAVSCTNHVYRQTGLDMQIMPASGGTTSLTENNVNDIVLKGEVQLESGAFRLELVNPAGITVKQWSFDAGQRYTIDLRLSAIEGTWHIKYASEAGVGKIQLAMHQDIGQ